jgi:hypothetical protein
MSTDIYAKSNDVHQVLAALLSPSCLRNGFKKLPGRRCCFVKPGRRNPALALAFEVQCSSFGRSEHGGSFTLNAGAGKIDPANLSSRHARILANCSDRTALAATLLEAQLFETRPTLKEPGQPWLPGADNWCRYYTREDVEKWGHFIAPCLPELLRGLLHNLSIPNEEFFDD